MFGERASRVISLRGMTVHTNLEAVAIMAATGLGGRTVLDDKRHTARAHKANGQLDLFPKA